MNLLENIVTDLSPVEFEKYCLELLKKTYQNYNDCIIRHNVNYEADDGTYQLDGLIEFSHFGVNYKTVIECKQYKNKVKREDIQKLVSTINSIGANKGMLISTSSYQSGAMRYANKHGIALLQIINGFITTLQQNSTIPDKIISHLQVPDYVFAWYNLDYECPMEYISTNKLGALKEFILKL